MNLPVSLVTAGLLGLLMMTQSAYVSYLRITKKISLGDGGDHELSRAIRIHANNAEHVPIFLLLLLIYELSGGAFILAAAIAGVFIAARLAHASGLLSRATTYRRQLGAGVAVLCEGVLAIALLLQLF